MTRDTRIDAEAAFACAALLEQGRKLQALSLVLTGIALYMLVIGHHPIASPKHAVVGPVVLLGFVALYFASRVGLDQKLMRRLATQADDGRLDLGAFDAGLTLAGLRPAAASTRTLGDRIAGATRLLRNQVIATVAQFLALIAGTIWLGSAP